MDDFYLLGFLKRNKKKFPCYLIILRYSHKEGSVFNHFIGNIAEILFSNTEVTISTFYNLLYIFLSYVPVTRLCTLF